MNLSSGQPEAFGAEAEHIGGLFARRRWWCWSVQLQAGMATRDVIGTAKGILKRQHTLTDDAAFAMLAAASQRSNVKLRDVAGWIVTDANTLAENTKTSHGRAGL